MSNRFPLSSRRAFLATGTASVAALAGCSVFKNRVPTEPLTLVDQVVVRSDTGRDESIRLTLVYAPPDKGTEFEGKE